MIAQGEERDLMGYMGQHKHFTTAAVKEGISHTYRKEENKTKELMLKRLIIHLSTARLFRSRTAGQQDSSTAGHISPASHGVKCKGPAQP